jgi:hypothetical protein
MSLMNALGSMLGSKNNYCPDCGMEMKSNGCCDDCGYGEEDDMMEEEDEQIKTQSLLDLRDTLQNALKQIDRMIVSNCDDGSDSSESKMQPQATVFVRQISKK